MFVQKVRKIIEDLKDDLPNAGVYTSTANRIYYDIRRMLRLFIGNRDGMGYSSPRRTYGLSWVEEQITVAAAGDRQYTLTKKLPPNSMIEAVCLNFDTVVVLDTAVKVGVGTVAAGGSELLLSTTTLTKNFKHQNRLGLIVGTAPNYPSLDPFYPGTPAAIGTSMVRASGVTTVTATHALAAGDMVRIIGATDASFNGDFLVTSVTSTTSFTFAQVGKADATAVITAAYFVPWIKIYLSAVDTNGVIVAASGVHGFTSGKIRVGILYSHVSDLQDA